MESLCSSSVRCPCVPCCFSSTTAPLNIVLGV